MLWLFVGFAMWIDLEASLDPRVVYVLEEYQREVFEYLHTASDARPSPDRLSRVVVPRIPRPTYEPATSAKWQDLSHPDKHRAI